MVVFVLSKHNKPLMPTKPRKARLLLESGKATKVHTRPFTIRLVHGSSGYKQELSLGIDTGYNTIGFSAVSEKKELFGGELNMLKGISERLKERAMHRRNRRGRLRHRKPGFLKDTKSEGWLAPSIQHKVDTHIKLVEYIKKLLPITRVCVEIANFDIAKIKNPDLHGKKYQEGEQAGFSHIREYILHRDHHTCQHPECKGRSKKLQVHHLGFWKQDRSDRPSNLITLCSHCHSAKNHQKGGSLWDWQPKVKTFRAATFMTSVRWRLVDQLQCEHTYGVDTKYKRSQLGLEKSHWDDAFVIANGTHQQRCEPTTITQKRKNNRSLEKFYDAKYLDTRDKTKKGGKDLCSGRRTRSQENLPECLRKYRGHKLKKGRRSIRRQRYSIQPKDLVLFEGKVCKAIGMQNKGKTLRLTNGHKAMSKNIKSIQVIFHQKTFVIE